MYFCSARLGGSDHESNRRFGSFRETEGVLLACCRERQRPYRYF